MRDLLPTPSALALPTIGAGAAPGPLADVAGLASDVERRFAALEEFCRRVGDTAAYDPEFRRLDAKVEDAVRALAEAPARDLGGLVAKARTLTRCAAINEDDVRGDLVGASLGRDILRLFGAAHPAPGG